MSHLAIIQNTPKLYRNTHKKQPLMPNIYGWVWRIATFFRPLHNWVNTRVSISFRTNYTVIDTCIVLSLNNGRTLLDICVISKAI